MSLRKRARVFKREFKLRAVERMLAGEGTRALARELHLRRKLLYQWKDAYLVSGGAAHAWEAAQGPVAGRAGCGQDGAGGVVAGTSSHCRAGEESWPAATGE